jgi:uncharacterized membrane protein YqgA involved in biofilm formation
LVSLLEICLDLIHLKDTHSNVFVVAEVMICIQGKFMACVGSLKKPQGLDDSRYHAKSGVDGLAAWLLAFQSDYGVPYCSYLLTICVWVC